MQPPQIESFLVEVEHDMFFLHQMETRKKSEPQTGFEPTNPRPSVI